MNRSIYFGILFCLLLLTVVRVSRYINTRQHGVVKAVLMAPVDTSNHVQTVKTRGVSVYVWNHNMLKTGMCVVVDLDKKTLVGEDSDCDNSLILAFAYIRDIIINRVNMAFPSPYSSILLGIVLGIEQEMPDKVHRSLSNGGLLHIIVASGYNINILLSVVVFLFRIVNKYLLLSICLLSIFGYLFISGFNPPLLRASIMGILFLLHEIDGSYIPPLVVLYLTTVLMLLFAPWLIKDISFIMSVSATLGLYFSSNYNSSAFYWPNLKGVVFVNLFLMPINVGIWGVVSIGGVIANILLLPYVPFIMVISLVGLITNNFFFKELFIFSIDYLLFVVDKINSLFEPIYLESFEPRLCVILGVITVITLLVINEIRSIRNEVRSC